MQVQFKSRQGKTSMWCIMQGTYQIVHSASDQENSACVGGLYTSCASGVLEYNQYFTSAPLKQAKGIGIGRRLGEQ